MQSTPITLTRETELTIASNRRHPDTLTAGKTKQNLLPSTHVCMSLHLRNK
jgi:hypothetical protein